MLMTGGAITSRPMIGSAHLILKCLLFRFVPTISLGNFPRWLIYIPPGANTNAAAELAAQNIHVMLNKYPEAPVFIMGDFNSCKLDSVLPSFEQYVDSPTRKNNVLDLCYGNINNAYTARVQPPLGSADHNIVFLLPQYRQLLKREKPVTYSITQWTEDTTAQLQGSFACTDWSIFDGDLDK